MPRCLSIALVLGAFATTLTSAHMGASGGVKVRMDAAEQVGQANRLLSHMAKSAQTDVAEARVAADVLISRSEDIPALLAERDETPPSRVWEDWARFLLRAGAMTDAAHAVKPAGEDARLFNAAVRDLGATCPVRQKLSSAAIDAGDRAVLAELDVHPIRPDILCDHITGIDKARDLGRKCGGREILNRLSHKDLCGLCTACVRLRLCNF